MPRSRFSKPISGSGRPFRQFEPLSHDGHLPVRTTPALTYGLYASMASSTLTSRSVILIRTRCAVLFGRWLRWSAGRSFHLDESKTPMRWPTCNQVAILIVTLAISLCCSCRSKLTTIEVQDLQQKINNHVARQRLFLDDTIKFFRFDVTDSGTEMVPEAVIYRTTRAERVGQSHDTAAAASIVSHTRKSSKNTPSPLPGWANDIAYRLTIGIILLLIVAYIARKT